MRMRLTRWLPALTTGLGVIHLIWVVADLPDEVRAMLTEGFVGTSNNDSRDPRRPTDRAATIQTSVGLKNLAIARIYGTLEYSWCGRIHCR